MADHRLLMRYVIVDDRMQLEISQRGGLDLVEIAVWLDGSGSPLCEPIRRAKSRTNDAFHFLYYGV